MKEYAVYDKEDNIITVGGSRHCAKSCGLTLGSFYTYRSKNIEGRNKYYIVEIEKSPTAEIS